MLCHPPDQLTGQALKLQAGHGGADVVIDLAMDGFQAGGINWGGDSVRQHAVQCFLLLGDRMMNGHETRP